MEITYLNLSRKKYGGRLYEDQLVGVLRHHHVVKEVNLIRYKRALILNVPWICFVWLKYKFFYSETLLITGILSAFRGVRAKKNIVIVHHIDYSNSPFFSRVLQQINFGFLLRFPDKFDAVIVVSKFWKTHMEQGGFKHVYLLYNSFDQSLFKISDDEILTFKRQYGLEGKPIIYLGNGQRKKGAALAYELLKDMDAHFLVTGNNDLNLPITHLNLNYSEYLCLLKASNVVVLMSQLVEGWNRIAHEALLLGTPVIGSGKGGMREVLESAGQKICEDAQELPSLVESITQRVSSADTVFLRSLDQNYFQEYGTKLFTEIFQLP